MTALNENHGSFAISTRFGGRKKIFFDARWTRPASRADYIEQIEATYAANRWEETEIRQNCTALGIAFKLTNDATDQELKTILDDMEKYRMILYTEDAQIPQTIEAVETVETIEPPVIVAVYADGGVIKKNPSPIGGTWAWCAVDASGNRIVEKSGVVPATFKRPVSNNHSEQIALTLALESLPEGWSGIVHSDSKIALGRIFQNWRTENLPQNISDRSKNAVARLGEIKTVLLQGHPTRSDLENGIGKKRGLPVSIHNVWCDKAATAAAAEYLKNFPESMPETNA